jgi:hypothetical protein
MSGHSQSTERTQIDQLCVGIGRAISNQDPGHIGGY